MRAAVLALVILSASPVHAAGDGPEWDLLLKCFNSNLATLLKSAEPIEAVYRGVRTICEDNVDRARAKLLRELAVDPASPKTLRDKAQAETYLTDRLDRALFAYSIKFKAVGGPTSLGE